MIWQDLLADSSLVESFINELSVSQPIARTLACSGIKSVQEATSFLDPKLANLEDPLAISNLQTAAQRIILAIERQETVLIFGDYDVDGVTSASLLVQFLKKFGLKANYVVPYRLLEGYGLTLPAVERALSEYPAPHLFISLDCGTNSLKEVAYIREQGTEVIIVDHHQSKESLPQDCTIVNPHVFDTADKPWQKLCTVGLVFKLCHGMLKLLRDQNHAEALNLKIKDYLDYVALGTIADMVPLKGENRILAAQGLKILTQAKRPWLQALFHVSGINSKQEIKPVDVSFRLAPRINASGRLADALLPINLLLSDNYMKSLEMAQQLDVMNRERQTIERDITLEAMHLAEQTGMTNQEAIILFNPNWHFGVVGIVAGKLARHFHKPTIILGMENGIAKGSGRSIEGLNLVELLKSCNDLMLHWGGHPAAVGLGMEPDKVLEFTERLNTTIRQTTPDNNKGPSIPITSWLSIDILTESFLKELDTLHPFGIDNPEPIFGLSKIQLNRIPEVFSQKHFRFQVPTNTNTFINGIAWNMHERIPPLKTSLDFAIKFTRNSWNNSSYPQIELIDWRITTN